MILIAGALLAPVTHEEHGRSRLSSNIHDAPVTRGGKVVDEHRRQASKATKAANMIIRNFVRKGYMNTCPLTSFAPSYQF